MPRQVPRVLLTLLVAYLGLAAAYHLTVPLWEAPDAVWHYAFVSHLARGGGLPQRADEGLTAPWRQQGSQPPLYYALAAPLVAMVNPADEEEVIRFNPHAAVGLASPAGNINRLVHTHREAFPWQGTALAAHLVGLLGIGLGAIAVVATYAAARLALPERPAVAWASAAIMAFNPQFLFLAGAIGNDVAVAAAGALCLWRLMAVLRHGPSRHQCFGLGLAFGLAALAKLNGLWLGPALVFAILVTVWLTAGPSLPLRLAAAARSLAWFAVPAAAVAGWWFLRNWLVLGDPSGLPVMLAVMQPRAVAPSAEELVRQMLAVWKSYWAVFGWFNLPAPHWVYALLSIMAAIGLTSLLIVGLASWHPREQGPTRARTAPAAGNRDGATSRFAWPRWPSRRPLERMELWCLSQAGLVTASLAVGLILWARLRYPQGRLLLPAATAFSLLLGAGWVAPLPRQWGQRLALVLNVTLVALATFLLFGVIRPAYRPRALVVQTAAQAGPVAAENQGLPSAHSGRAGQPTSTPPPSTGSAGTGPRPESAGLSRQVPRLARYLQHWQLANIDPSFLPSQPLARFGERLVLWSTRVEGPRPIHAGGDLLVHPGETITVSLLWSVDQAVEADYSVFLHLVDQDGVILAQRDSYPQSGLAPTSEWLPTLLEPTGRLRRGAAAAAHSMALTIPRPAADREPAGWATAGRFLYPDEHRLVLPATVGVSGPALMLLGLYDQATGRRLTTDRGGEHLSLASVLVRTVRADNGLPNPLDIRFGEAIHLVGFELDRRTVKAGRKLHLTLYWRAGRRVATDYKVSLQLRRGPAETWGQTDEEPDDSRRPTSSWHPGELIRDYHALAVYDDAPSGAYELFLKLYDPQSGRALTVDDHGGTELSFGQFRVYRPDEGW